MKEKAEKKERGSAYFTLALCEIFTILVVLKLILEKIMGIQDNFYTENFISMAPGGYFDMFLSVSVPYVILALVYYISYFKQVKKANKTIKELQKLRYEEKKE